MTIFVIAEAGVNHNGSLDTAKKLADAARAADADAVKFQLFDSRELWGDDRIAHLELDDSEMEALYWHCQNIGIEFMCTPFHVWAVEILYPIVERYKVSSGCLYKPDILVAVGDTQKPVILSTGMSNMQTIEQAINIMQADDLTLLHCTSAYPCPPEQVNMRAMDTLRRFGKPVGYSDHTDTILASLVAAAAGAEVIEKHLTLDRNAEGPDHKASIEPDAFTHMVKEIRRIDVMIGSAFKDLQPAEMHVFQQWRQH